MRNIIRNLEADRDAKLRQYDEVTRSAASLKKEALKHENRLPGILLQVESLNKAIKLLRAGETK